MAPAFIMLFLSVVFLVGLAPGTLIFSGLAPSAVGATLADLLGYWALDYAPALWGAETRRPLAVVATSTFDVSGAPWMPGTLPGLVANPCSPSRSTRPSIGASAA